MVVVGPRAADVDHPVDRARPAEDAAARIGQPPVPDGGMGKRLVRPVVRAAAQLDDARRIVDRVVVTGPARLDRRTLAPASTRRRAITAPAEPPPITITCASRVIAGNLEPRAAAREPPGTQGQGSGAEVASARGSRRRHVQRGAVARAHGRGVLPHEHHAGRRTAVPRSAVRAPPRLRGDRARHRGAERLPAHVARHRPRRPRAPAHPAAAPRPHDRRAGRPRLHDHGRRHRRLRLLASLRRARPAPVRPRRLRPADGDARAARRPDARPRGDPHPRRGARRAPLRGLRRGRRPRARRRRPRGRGARAGGHARRVLPRAGGRRRPVAAAPRPGLDRRAPRRPVAHAAPHRGGELPLRPRACTGSSRPRA